MSMQSDFLRVCMLHDYAACSSLPCSAGNVACILKPLPAAPARRLLDRRFEGHLAEACAPFNCNLGLLVSTLGPFYAEICCASLAWPGESLRGCSSRSLKAPLVACRCPCIRAARWLVALSINKLQALQHAWH